MLLVNPPQDSIIDFLKEPSTIIAIIALIVSVLSLIFSASYNRRSLNLTKEHNMLSVKPFFLVTTGVVDNHYCIKLSNEGFGAGIFENLTYTFNNKIYTSLWDVVKIKHRELGVARLIDINDRAGFPAKGAVIGVGGFFDLFYAINPIDGKFTVTSYNSFFKGIFVNIKYKDIYENEYIIDEEIIFV